MSIYKKWIVKTSRFFAYNIGEVRRMDKHYKDYIQIGLNIMRCRKEQGLTQEQLAELTGYSQNHIQRVETAVSKPTVGLLLDVSAALNVPLTELLEIRKR